MRNIIRADVYRILRGKGLYITLGILLAVIVIQVTAGINMNAGVNVDSFGTLENMDMENPDLSTLIHSPTGAEAPFQVMAASSNLVYLLLPFLIFTGSADFSSGTAKNTLASGVSRSKYYFSKLILSCISCTLLLLLYVLLSTLLATAVNGFAGTLNGEFLWNVAKVFLLQLWLLLACACIGNMIMFVFRRSSAAIGIYLAFFLVPAMIIVALSLVSEWFKKLCDYELTTSIGSLTGIDLMSTGDIARILVVGAGYMAIALVAGFTLFKKAEVK